MPYSLFSLATLFEYLLMHAYITCYQIFLLSFFKFFYFFRSHCTTNLMKKRIRDYAFANRTYHNNRYYYSIEIFFNKENERFL